MLVAARLAGARLEQRRVRHGQRRQRQADAEPLQLRQAAAVAGDAAGERHQHGVVGGHADEDADHLEGGQRRRRHVERADAGVHRLPLLHERRRHLRRGGEEEHHRRPHGGQPQQHLDLLHLRHRAQHPRARHRHRRRRRHDGRLVQERELIGVLDDPVVAVGELVQERAVAGKLHAAIPDGGDYHLAEPREGAPRRRVGRPEAAQAGAEEEGGERDGHDRRRDAEAEPPAGALLHPHQHGGRQQRADVDAEVVPVEEGRPRRRRRVVIELVGAQRRGARLDAADAEGDEVEPQEHGGAEDAIGGCIKVRGCERRRDCERDHPLSQIEISP